MTITEASPDVGRPHPPATMPAKFIDPLRIPPVVRPHDDASVRRLTVRMRSAWVRLHSELPTTRVWAYDGLLPGPTIEVRRGQRVLVDWVNEIGDGMPVTAVVGPDLSQNDPGTSGASPDKDVAALPAWTVIHLHGGRTMANGDGWTENAFLAGGHQPSWYDNDQPAAMLWYHDHAMGITRFNVVAGLSGMYVIRDDEEDLLRLPSGRYEVPLMLCDRNLETDADGSLTGRLLHKTEQDTGEYFGPFTLVNGTIWPHFDVEARQYRIRVLNASNARAYRLVLVDQNGDQVMGAIKQIGTDSGLLGRPVEVPESGLILGSAERADLIVDFRGFRGTSLRLVNTAAAPFKNAAATVKPGVPDPDPDHRLGEPDVMEFRVGAEVVGDPFRLPAHLAGSFTRVTHDDLPANHKHRTVGLVERDGMLQLWELAETDPPTGKPPVDGIVQVTGADGKVLTYKRMAAMLEDAVNWFPAYGAWEVWRILNLTEDTHPFHVHLVRFQALARDTYDVQGFDSTAGGTTAGRPVAYQKPGVLDANEQGWKDIIRVNPHDMVSIAAEFSGGTGRYMYHCHMIEHEDNDMMRPFVVVPGPVQTVKPMDGGMPM